MVLYPSKLSHEQFEFSRRHTLSINRTLQAQKHNDQEKARMLRTS